MNIVARLGTYAAMVLPLIEPASAALPGLQGPASDTYYFFEGRRIPLLVLSDQVAVFYSTTQERTAAAFRPKWIAQRAGGFASNRDPMEIYAFDGRAPGTGKPLSGLAAFTREIERAPGIRELRPVYHDPELGRDLVCTGRILVRLDRPGALQGLLAAFPLGTPEPLDLPRAYSLATGESPLDIANRIAAFPGVEWAEPEFIGTVKSTRIPNDPMYKQAWHLNGTGGRGLMAHLAWDIGWGDENIVVGVYDDGGDPKGHPDLNTSPNGMNWITNPPSKAPWAVPSGFPHGAACAGAVGAIGDNNLGVIGVAPGVTILPMKITNYPDGGFASDRNLGDGILHAAESAHIGTVSIIGMRGNYVRDAIKEAALNGRKGKGFLFFTSSGNGGTGTLTYPSLFEYSISVGASTSSDQKAGYSQWGETGKTVEFLSPSGVPTTSSGTSYSSSFGGTSAATPVAAGVAALILSTNPELTRAQVLDIMRSTCDKIGGVTYGASGTHPQYGHGRLNAFSALKKLPPYIVLEPKDTLVSMNQAFSTSITARGYQVTYRWQKEGAGWQDLPTGGTDRVLSIVSVLPTHAGRYRFIVSNANGSDTSMIFKLGISNTSLVKSPESRDLRVGVSRESGRMRFDLSLPRSGQVHFEIVAPDGKRKTVVDQRLARGRHVIFHPYRFLTKSPHAYRLTVDGQQRIGAFQP